MRKHDTGWRDSRLNLVHAAFDIPFPVAGMTFPTVEYDRGEALAVINYIRRDVAGLPKGLDTGAAYAAFSELRGPMGAVLPFITVQYDPRNWAVQLFAHNGPAASLLGTPVRKWMPCTELHFVQLLYRLRGRTLPDYVKKAMDFSTAPWLRLDGTLPAQGWDGQDMSVRRRAYEPEGPGILFSDRNPCSDIDLAVVERGSGQVALIVDYKLHTAYIQPNHKTHQAMAGLVDGNGNPIPSVIVKYDPTDDRWTYGVLPLNASAQALLYRFLESISALGSDSCDGWTSLSEDQYAGLLESVRDGR